jgi:hypothetical protein
MSRLAAVLTALSVTAAIAGAAPATADPADLVPFCSGDQTPMDNNCRVAPSQVFTHDSAPGANPEVPLGTGFGESLMTGQGQGS